MAAPPRAGLTREVLQRARFVIFAKEAPATLPEYDVDTDFCYCRINKTPLRTVRQRVPGLLVCCAWAHSLTELRVCSLHRRLLQRRHGPALRDVPSLAHHRLPQRQG